MNEETYNTVVIVTVVTAFIAVCIFAGLYTNARTALDKCRYELDGVRAELAAAESRERELTETLERAGAGVQECLESAGRTDRILQETTGTVAGLREALQGVRDYESELIEKLTVLEKQLSGNSRNSSTGNNISGY